jgi:hypothetical protein
LDGTAFLSGHPFPLPVIRSPLRCICITYGISIIRLHVSRHAFSHRAFFPPARASPQRSILALEQLYPYTLVFLHYRLLRCCIAVTCSSDLSFSTLHPVTSLGVTSYHRRVPRYHSHRPPTAIQQHPNLPPAPPGRPVVAAAELRTPLNQTHANATGSVLLRISLVTPCFRIRPIRRTPDQYRQAVFPNPPPAYRHFRRGQRASASSKCLP